jgi:FixJ family two-component response regulator
MSSSPRPCILVVEDDDAVRRSLQLLLRSRGMEVRAYASACSALGDSAVMEGKCLIADLMMPEVDGIDLLRKLRENGWSGPAVLVSGHLTPQLEELAMSAGYGAVLHKPVSEGTLTGLMADLMPSTADAGGSS